MFKVNNRNSRAYVGNKFKVNFEHNSYLVLVFLLLNFELVYAGWAQTYSLTIFSLANSCFRAYLKKISRVKMSITTSIQNMEKTI